MRPPGPHIMTSDLKARFRKFVRTLDGFEDIDALLMDHHSERIQRADYLSCNRTVIVEEKTLEVDPKDKRDKYIHRLIQENVFPNLGRLLTKQHFYSIPDGKDYIEI
jgi:hypothetical protein